MSAIAISFSSRFWRRFAFPAYLFLLAVLVYSALTVILPSAQQFRVEHGWNGVHAWVFR